MTNKIEVTQADKELVRYVVSTICPTYLWPSEHGMWILAKKFAAHRTRNDAQVNALVEALKKWQEWEAKWLDDDRCWETGDGSHVPQDLFDEYIEGPQAARAAALAAWEGQQ